ncbi:MAG: hypothetical protein K2X48_20230 [Chitinophagaceae bacterium]|nr:hypothetical protein [Chitinophagaceae bacterium]
MKKVLLITTIFIVSFSSCKKNKIPEPGDYILTRSLGFYLKDSTTNQNLIGKNGHRYHPDSIRVFTINSNQIDKTGKVVLDSLNNYYAGILYFFQLVSKPEDINIFPIDISVYVYLSNTDTDTLKIKKAPFQDFNFYWNNTFISTTSALSNTVPSLTIKK